MGIEIRLKKSSGNFTKKGEFLKFAQTCARVCYSERDWDDLEKEELNLNLMEKKILPSGHHSVFEHINLTFYIKNIPKALAMVLNNEKQYATSEKSARYTQMEITDSRQKKLYEKWMEIFLSLIEKKYSRREFPLLYERGTDIKTEVEKIAQENARYMTSVFTPTKMVYTINLRQLNFIIQGFQKFIDENSSKNWFNEKLSWHMKEFISQVKEFRIPYLENKTERYLSFFGEGLEKATNSKEIPEFFGTSYSTTYLLSFAGLAQAQRHRTISYHVINGTESNAPNGFYIPRIIKNRDYLEEEWIDNLKSISEYDFPQAQLLKIAERGNIEDFRSKTILRLCSNVQHELMESTKEIAEKYSQHMPSVKEWIKPKCKKGIKCNEKCRFGPNNALERLV